MNKYVPGLLPQQEAPTLKNAIERELRKISQSFDNVLRAPLVHPGLATAWVCFNGADGSILSSHNVASVTRSSTGVYIVNFETPMANANYVWSGAMQQAAGNVDGDFNIVAGNGQKTISSLTVRTRRSTNTAGTNPTLYDFPTVSITVHGGK